jgi:hypothetical protein
MKVCSICSQEKVLDDFSLDPNDKTKQRRRAACKECRRNSGKVYYQENREKVLDRTAEYQKAHPEMRRQKLKRYRDNNPEKVKENQRKQYAKRSKAEIAEASRKWREKNPERAKELNKRNWRGRKDKYLKTHPEYYNVQAGKRRASLLQAMPTWLSKEQHEEIKSIYREAKRKILETGTRFEVDHIEPLRGKTSCGLHVPWNLRIVTRSENARKHNKLIST